MCTWVGTTQEEKRGVCLWHGRHQDLVAVLALKAGTFQQALIREWTSLESSPTNWQVDDQVTTRSGQRLSSPLQAAWNPGKCHVWFIFLVPEIKPRASPMPDKHSATDLHPSPLGSILGLLPHQPPPTLHTAQPGGHQGVRDGGRACLEPLTEWGGLTLVQTPRFPLHSAFITHKLDKSRK